MIDNIFTLTPTIAGDIPQFTIVQIWDEGLSATRLVMCKGHTDTWSVFAYDTGYTFRMLKTDTLQVVTNVQEWDDLTVNDLIEIELDLMVRGA
jgi:hypothetical protein